MVWLVNIHQNAYHIQDILGKMQEKLDYKWKAIYTKMKLKTGGH